MKGTTEQKILKLAIVEAEKDLQKLRNAAKEKLGNTLKINGRQLYSLYNADHIQRAKKGLRPEVLRYENTNIIEVWNELVETHYNSMIEEVLKTRHHGKD
jgi:TRAP-type C4-dicarboxylate transport system substrate-binding protein